MEVNWQKWLRSCRSLASRERELRQSLIAASTEFLDHSSLNCWNFVRFEPPSRKIAMKTILCYHSPFVSPLWRARILPCILKSLQLVVLCALALIATPQGHGALVLDLQSANFDAGSGTWTDASSSSNDAVANNTSYKLTLETNATPSGASAVDFSENETLSNYFLKLTNPLTSATFTTTPTFTLVFVAKIDALPLSSSQALFGGSWPNNTAGPGYGGALTLRLRSSDGYFDLTAAGKADLGSSDPTQYTAGWGIYAATYDGSTEKLYLNGDPVATRPTSVAFGDTGATFIGESYATGIFTGQMAAAQVYDSALDATAISSLSTSLHTTYLVPEPSTFAFFIAGGSLLVCRRRRRDS